MSGPFTSTFRVGQRYRCTVSFPGGSGEDGLGQLAVEWSPSKPQRLTPAERQDWLHGVQAMVDEIARYDGVPFVVFEV